MTLILHEHAVAQFIADARQGVKVDFQLKCKTGKCIASRTAASHVVIVQHRCRCIYCRVRRCGWLASSVLMLACLK